MSTDQPAPQTTENAVAGMFAEEDAIAKKRDEYLALFNKIRQQLYDNGVTELSLNFPIKGIVQDTAIAQNSSLKHIIELVKKGDGQDNYLGYAHTWDDNWVLVSDGYVLLSSCVRVRA